MIDKATEGIDRRTFVKQAAVRAGDGMDARSYARVLGANDRIRLGQLGCGDAARAMSIWCNWRPNRCRWKRLRFATSGAWRGSSVRAQVKQAFNLDPQSYKYSEDMLARKDIDGVMIATGDFSMPSYAWKWCGQVRTAMWRSLLPTCSRRPKRRAMP